MSGDHRGIPPAPGGDTPPEEWRTGAGPGVVDMPDWTVPPRGSVRSRFPAPSGPLACLSMGQANGESIVLVPGVTGSKEDFSLIMPLLADAGFRVFSYDLAGQYESTAAGPENLVPPRRRYDYDLFVHDLIAVLESVGAPSHVLGYSFAGIVTQLALVRRPDLFSSLTLMSCPPEPGQGFRGLPVLGRLSGILGARIDSALMIWAIRRNFTHVPPSRLRFIRHRFTLTRRNSVTDVFELMKHTPDLRAALKSSPLPKLVAVAVGEHDVWPLALHRRFAADIGARLSVYPGGHGPCETSPAELSDDLLNLILDR